MLSDAEKVEKEFGPRLSNFEPDYKSERDAEKDAERDALAHDKKAFLSAVKENDIDAVTQLLDIYKDNKHEMLSARTFYDGSLPIHIGMDTNKENVLTTSGQLFSNFKFQIIDLFLFFLFLLIAIVFSILTFLHILFSDIYIQCQYI